MEEPELEDQYKNPQLVQIKVPPVKDKSRNPIQITAEQILKDPSLHQMDDIKLPTQRIMDEDELRDYKDSKRKEFEDKIRKQKHHMGTWIKYAQWEEGLEEYARGRSIFERALDIDYQNVSLWLKYAEMEMKNKFINHARNLWERATKLMPRVDQFWFKYIYMEEMLGFYLKARRIFEKWISWKPGERAWMAYVKFEERMGEKENCRRVMYKYMDAHPKLESYLKVARYESKLRNYNDSRFIYERTLHDLGDEAMTENFFITWAKFEISLKEYDRAREIFKFGIENIEEEKGKRLYEEYLKFEKQFGSQGQIDELVFDKRRRYYRGLLKQFPQNYDFWFDLIFLEQETKNWVKVRQTFEQAIANLPPGNEKRLWKRYIYLWISYAIFEEVDAKEMHRAKNVYQRVLKLIPHKEFTFSRIWIMYAQFLIRAKDLKGARKVFGMAIGISPSEKIFKAYIQMEMQLTNFDRCRIIYQKFLLTFPDKPGVWINFAEMECLLQEHKRARMIYESAIQLPVLNMPEAVWKAYIDMELRLKEFEKARTLYRRLLKKTKHVKVWISYAQFEKENREVGRMREIYKEADEYFKDKDELKEHRKILLEKWLKDEKEIGDESQIEFVKKKQPKIVRKQRKVFIENESGEQEQDGWEEFETYVFPDGAQNFRIPKLVKQAYLWAQKRKKLKTEDIEGKEDGGDTDVESNTAD